MESCWRVAWVSYSSMNFLHFSVEEGEGGAEDGGVGEVGQGEREEDKG